MLSVNKTYILQESLSRIKKLPTHVVNQIAAGEVVERPSSAIKELIDNSIDAGAKSIQIQIISQDGRSFRVIDDGSGIHKDEIELAFAPHATSKISEVDDLNELSTLGFRGEALASISSIAKVTCISKHFQSNNAYKATFDENHQLVVSPAAFAKGTCIEVQDLFYNVPARLKFLKRAETEISTIQDTVRELAVANPSVAIELQIKNKTVLKTTGKADLITVLQEIFSSRDLDFKYLEVTKEDFHDTVLKGYVAPLSAARSDKRCLVIIVNDRPIKCETILKAIRSVYRPFLPPGKFPQLVLSLDMLPSLVDFNVHPTKKEVRYTKPQIIYQLVHSALEKHLILNSSVGLINSFHASSQFQGFSSREENSEVAQLNIHSEEAFVSSGFPATAVSSSEGQNYKNLSAKNYEVDRIQSFVKKLDSLNSQAGSQRNDDLFSLEKNPDLQHVQNRDSYKEIYRDNLLKISEMRIENQKNNSQSLRSDRGNSTDFTLSSGALSLSGELSGEKWIRDKFLKTLNAFLQEVSNEMSLHQNQSEQISFTSKSKKSRPKVALAVLERVWARDNWRCVYCGKHLLHPALVKKALRVDPHSWVSRMGSGNKIIKTHILREHQATYDHLLPYKFNSSLAVQPDNLFAACRECNQAKSSSIDFSKWQAKTFSPWSKDEEIKIGNLLFEAGFCDAEFKTISLRSEIKKS